MPERILTTLHMVEKGGRLVFPVMPFSQFPEYIALLKKALEKRIQLPNEK